MQDYENPDSDTWRNQLTDKTEGFFIAVFSLECIMKILAMGFVLSEGCYLWDMWNWLDFIVVITGILSIFPNISNVSALWTFRLFWPLWSLTTLPSMRVLVGTLLASVIQLGNIFILAIFFFGIFAILGMSLWAGALHYWCRTTLEPVNGDWPVVENDFRVCGGFHKCEVICGSLYDAFDKGFNITVPLDWDSKTQELNYGITNFDNFLTSFLSIFQVSTLEGWTDIMFMIQDAYNWYVSALYFIFCIIICNYFILNLNVAVMLENFENIHEDDTTLIDQLYGDIGEDIDLLKLKKEI